MTPLAHDRELPAHRLALALSAFLIWILLAAFLPTRWTPSFVFSDVPVAGYDVILLLATLFAFFAWLCAGRISIDSRWHANLPAWFLAVLVYAAFSLFWAGLDRYDTRAMLFTLILAAAAFLLPYWAIAVLSAAQIKALLRLVAFSLAAVGAVYSAQSFFALNLRSELGSSYSVGFGVERVKGPLFAASTGHIVLLPAAAFLLEDWLVDRSHRLSNTLGLFALSVAIAGLGSRGSLFAVVAFFITSLFVVRGIRGKFLTVILLLAGTGLAGGIIFTRATAERLFSLRDPGRVDTYQTALRAVQTRGIAAALSGSGYGSLWPWYLPDIQSADTIGRGGDIRQTDFGRTLYQPHSVLLVLGVELGAIGLLFLLKLWGALARLFPTKGPYPLFAAGVVCASLTMFVDLFIFKNPKISALWWFYLLAALRWVP